MPDFDPIHALEQLADWLRHATAITVPQMRQAAATIGTALEKIRRTEGREAA